MAKATPEQMAQTMIDNLPEKTGKSLVAWLSVVAAAALEKHGEIVRHLKTDHGVSHGYANLIASKFLSAGASSSDDALVDKQYDGAKASLRPICDKVVALAESFGKDVEIAPKKTYISLRRNKQFAIVQPSTRTRVDLGINLKGEPVADRLEASGSFNAMVSHRVRLAESGDVDAAVKAWLRAAYDAA